MSQPHAGTKKLPGGCCWAAALLQACRPRLRGARCPLLQQSHFSACSVHLHEPTVQRHDQSNGTRRRHATHGPGLALALGQEVTTEARAGGGPEWPPQNTSDVTLSKGSFWAEGAEKQQAQEELSAPTSCLTAGHSFPSGRCPLSPLQHQEEEVTFVIETLGA